MQSHRGEDVVQRRRGAERAAGMALARLLRLRTAARRRRGRDVIAGHAADSLDWPTAAVIIATLVFFAIVVWVMR